MLPILAVLILVDLGALGYTTCAGFLLSDVESVRFHFLCGVTTTILVTFTHSLVVFYLVGTSAGVREAVRVDERLERHFVPLIRQLRRRVVPVACAGALFVVVAAVMGAEVHSRLIGAGGTSDLVTADGGAARLPLRGVSVWWLHLVVVGLALVVNLGAFVVEFDAGRSLRGAIGEIGRLLELGRGSSGTGNPRGSGVADTSDGRAERGLDGRQERPSRPPERGG